MPYYGQYRGDYRTYGYGRGDPGFLSDLWGGIKKVAGVAVGTAIGGPIGGLIGGTLTGGGRTPGIAPPTVGKPQPRQDLLIGGGPISVRSTDFYPPVPRFTGSGMPVHGRMTPGAAAGTGCCPRGYHLAKDGSGRCVRNRRMNVANPRALRRSMRRVQGFEKLARRTITFTRRVKMKK